MLCAPAPAGAPLTRSRAHGAVVIVLPLQTDRLPDTVIASLAAVKKATISPVAAMIADRQAVKKAFDKA